MALVETDEHPCCPSCEAPLDRLHWHKVRGGPALLTYVAVISCAACGAVLDVLEGGGKHGAAGAT
jgi:hypothetical protein